MRRVDQRAPLTLVLEGHLTEEALSLALDDAASRLSEPRALVVDCTSMTGYDREARELFVNWNRAHKATLTHVAIITFKPLWRIVISAMSLASTQEMRAFDYVDEARRWIDLGEEADDVDQFIDG